MRRTVAWGGAPQVFPQLYLPVMGEANKRVHAPWRQFVPTPSLVRHQLLIRRLNSYIIGIIKRRWAERQKGVRPVKEDILDRILTSLEVRPLSPPRAFVSFSTTRCGGCDSQARRLAALASEPCVLLVEFGRAGYTRFGMRCACA